MGILIGYSNVGYRVLLNGRVIVARHVDIVEENIKCIGLDFVESDNDKNDENSENESIDETFVNRNENLNESMDDTENERELRKSQRDKNPPKKFDDYYVYNSSIFVNMCRTDIPHTFEEAMNCDE
uniref:Uncharacterized protein LOC114345358 n=1 Tax=Diabrotica virgifera virgifera TaxID=50390 RepID=A0A6P7H0L4_DIAVI